MITHCRMSPAARTLCWAHSLFLLASRGTRKRFILLTSPWWPTLKSLQAVNCWMRPRKHPLKQLALSTHCTAPVKSLITFSHHLPLSSIVSLAHCALCSCSSLHTWKMAWAQSGPLNWSKWDIRTPVRNLCFACGSVRATRRRMNGSVPFDQNRVFRQTL